MIHAMVHLAAGSMSFSASTIEELFSIILEVVPSGGDVNLALSSIVIQSDIDPLCNPEYRAALPVLLAED